MDVNVSASKQWLDDFDAENRPQLTANLQRVWEMTFALCYMELRSKMEPEKVAKVAGVVADEARAACFAELAFRNES